MTTPRFEATFRLRLDRPETWRRLTRGEVDDDGSVGDGSVGAAPTGSLGAGDRLWLPGFDARATVRDAEHAARLVARKDDEPCAGTDIVVTLEDDETGTRVHVVQSGFGDWLPAPYDAMAIGWRFIVADLQAYLATGVHARRHLRGWGDLGAEATVADGGIRLGVVRADGLAARLGLADGDLLVTLANAPVAALDDLVTVLRVLDGGAEPAAEWIRDGELCSAGRPVGA